MHIADSLFVPFQNNQVIGSSRIASESPEYHIGVFLMFLHSFLYVAVEKSFLHLDILWVYWSSVLHFWWQWPHNIVYSSHKEYTIRTL